MNGRPDPDYRHWLWQPDDCNLPRFDPKIALVKLRGKRLMFVRDSLQRGQWQSFICLVNSVIPEGQIHETRPSAYNLFGRVESNTDYPVPTEPRKRIVRVDSVAKHAKNWIGVDFLVFSTYVWWLGGLRIKSLRSSFLNESKEGYEELDALVSYRMGLKTWANWVDSNVNPNRTHIFFTTLSPTPQSLCILNSFLVDWAVEMRIRPPELETSICDVNWGHQVAGLGEVPMHVGVDASLSRIHRSPLCVDILCYLRR
ncbi:protein trichome birefringence-like 3 [Dorcoceras hygrometricum]|uniref:Protein trichome birefringence-like 3 n=1 Tax=Dorcoceras hygrometricum TaxID=472368 RepID=A0A2Z7AKF5_9LAMI|nr:protein trichome birefringence-like 3 [Dorcoceras hygrometricum]